jgi:hypothetical protein
MSLTSTLYKLARLSADLRAIRTPASATVPFRKSAPVCICASAWLSDWLSKSA